MYQIKALDLALYHDIILNECKNWRVVWMFGRSFPQHILTVLRQWQLQMMPGREILGREVLKYAR